MEKQGSKLGVLSVVGTGNKSHGWTFARMAMGGFFPRWFGWLAVLLALELASGWAARGECVTNESVLVDLTSWTVAQYGPFGQGPAQWIFSDNNTTVIQTNNADASMLLSPFNLQSDRIQGTWRVETDFDDDFMGFVFGYQDSQHFYLFDWKQGLHPVRVQ